MPRRPKFAARVESLEGRQVLSTIPTAPLIIADINHDGRVDLKDERILVASYGSHVGQARYNPAADVLHLGTVGPADALYVLQHLTNPPIEHGAPHLDLALLPSEQVKLPRSANSGGMTRSSTVTIVGLTTPNSMIFTDTSAANYKFHGPAFVADDQGYFSQTVHLKDALTNFEFLVVTPSGQRTIRSYPIVDKLLVTHGHGH